MPYLEKLSENAKDNNRILQIEKMIKEKGYWAESYEWRMSTFTEMRIEPINKDDVMWFKVRVVCDHEWVCHCPNIERAVEFLGIY